MDKKEQVKTLIRIYDAKLYDIWVQNPDTTERMFAKEEGVQNWLIQQLNALYQQQPKPKMVVCPKPIDICDEDCCSHLKPHRHTDDCDIPCCDV